MPTDTQIMSPYDSLRLLTSNQLGRCTREMLLNNPDNLDDVDIQTEIVNELRHYGMFVELDDIQLCLADYITPYNMRRLFLTTIGM